MTILLLHVEQRSAMNVFSDSHSKTNSDYQLKISVRTNIQFIDSLF